MFYCTLLFMTSGASLFCPEAHVGRVWSSPYVLRVKFLFFVFQAWTNLKQATQRHDTHTWPTHTEREGRPIGCEEHSLLLGLTWSPWDCCYMAKSQDPGKDFLVHHTWFQPYWPQPAQLMSGGEGSKRGRWKVHSPPKSPKFPGDLPQNRTEALRDLKRRSRKRKETGF